MKKIGEVFGYGWIQLKKGLEKAVDWSLIDKVDIEGDDYSKKGK